MAVVVRSHRMRGLVTRTVVIWACRTTLLITGWQVSLRYGDWRQVWAYPIELTGAIPDAIWVRLIVSPRSAAWPVAMCFSIAVSSAVIAWVTLDRGRR